MEKTQIKRPVRILAWFFILFSLPMLVTALQAYHLDDYETQFVFTIEGLCFLNVGVIMAFLEYLFNKPKI